MNDLSVVNHLSNASDQRRVDCFGTRKNTEGGTQGQEVREGQWIRVLTKTEVERCVSDLCELVKGQLVTAGHQFLDDLSDPVAWQTQVGSLEQVVELVFADEAVVVHVWMNQRSEVKTAGRESGQTGALPHRLRRTAERTS